MIKSKKFKRNRNVFLVLVDFYAFFSKFYKILRLSNPLVHVLSGGNDSIIKKRGNNTTFLIKRQGKGNQQQKITNSNKSKTVNQKTPITTIQHQILIPLFISLTRT
jgi:hypothetical protein